MILGCSNTSRFTSLEVEPELFVAVKVKGYAPPVPGAGVPEISKTVPYWLARNPAGIAPSVTVTVPLVITAVRRRGPADPAICTPLVCPTWNSPGSTLTKPGAPLTFKVKFALKSSTRKGEKPIAVTLTCNG